MSTNGPNPFEGDRIPLELAGAMMRLHSTPADVVELRRFTDQAIKSPRVAALFLSRCLAHWGIQLTDRTDPGSALAADMISGVHLAASMGDADSDTLAADRWDNAAGDSRTIALAGLCAASMVALGVNRQDVKASGLGPFQQFLKGGLTNGG